MILLSFAPITEQLKILFAGCDFYSDRHTIRWKEKKEMHFRWSFLHNSKSTMSRRL